MCDMCASCVSCVSDVWQMSLTAPHLSLGLGLGLVGYQVIKNQIIEEIGRNMEEYVLYIH